VYATSIILPKQNKTLNPFLRSDLNTPNDAFVALTLSRYHPVKALDVLIKAAEPIKNCHLWLAGEGADGR
jgi:glycosyltransferase involved in cell wall biosynthesis